MTCASCDGLKCLSCAGNRVLISGKCNCPLLGVPNDKTAFCSTCEDAVVKVRMLEDLETISVTFPFPIKISIN